MLIYILLIADVAELADALDLGSSVFDVGVQVLSAAPKDRLLKTCLFLLKKSKFNKYCFVMINEDYIK